MTLTVPGLTFTYNCFRMKGTTKSDWVGGCSNAANAVEIANAIWIGWEAANVNLYSAVAVFDSTDKIIAYIGRHKDMII